jgi:hypothetical protein
LRALPEYFENLFKPFNLTFRLVAVFFEREFQVRRIGALRHLGQGPKDLFFRVVDIFQTVMEKVFKRFGWHGVLLNKGRLPTPPLCNSSGPIFSEGSAVLEAISPFPMRNRSNTFVIILQLKLEVHAPWSHGQNK